ncbi:MAG: hypothetical protein Q9226_002444 [Calogaya cf. arnoldii]
MGVQAYLTQGDAPYIQQYDNRGYPQNRASRDLSSRSRRAQNDVLATVGVLRRPPQVAQDTHHSRTQSAPSSVLSPQELIAENHLGCSLYNANVVLDKFCHSCMTRARHRLQTFRFYAGVPLHRILITEWKVFGPSLFLLGGLSGDFLTFLMFETQPMFYDFVRLASEPYVVKLLPQNRSVFFQRLLKIGSSTVIYLWVGICLSTLRKTDYSHSLRAFHWSFFATFRLPSILQGLGLRPLSPMSQRWTDYIPSSAGSLIKHIPLPTSLTLGSGFGYLASIATSPMVVLCLFDIIRYATRFKALTYISLVVHHPDERHSGKNDLDIPEETYAKSFPTIRGQLNKDWTSFSNYFKALTSWLEPPILHNEANDSAALIPDNPGISNEAHVAGMLPVSTNDSHEDRLAELDDNAEAAFSENDSDPSYSERGYPTTDCTRVISSQCKSRSSSRPVSLVTTLTTCMADTLTTSLSDLVADILLLPLEGLLVRSVALTYLTTPGGAAFSAMGLRNEIYPLGSWLGTGVGSGRAMDYVRKLVIFFGADMLLSFMIWQATAGATWWVGKRKFKWGRR